MKESVLILLIIILLPACQSAQFADSSLNATEKKLVGKWYNDFQPHKDQAQLLAGHDTPSYLEFLSKPAGRTSWMQGVDATYGEVSGIIDAHNPKSINYMADWRYDDLISTLIISEVQTISLSIITLTETKLVLRRITSGDTFYTYFHR